ncbi:MAG: tRNA-dihydrouridine synthase [Candidatus Abawacabacteria bacterium]|nr:tRNA-dihydrouridine synthase [Candidatus Abawacabacteria bacterium]
MHRGFWDQLPEPILGLSPMDGVTDAAFRFIVAQCGKPDLLITEFVSVEGMNVGNPEKVFLPFLYDEIERPIVAQVFGTNIDAFYQAAIMVHHMGFDGIDINMGCPAKNVSAKGAGAGLIRTPDLAREIIRAVKQGAHDAHQGKTIEDLKIPQRTKDFLAKTYSKHRATQLLPVSVKTRIGYDEIVVEKWVENLLLETPANISLHGRTLMQMYSGTADWQAIARAAKIIKATTTSVLGNGDIKDLSMAKDHITNFGVDGVLIGRATFGNPWFFSQKEVHISQRLQTAIQHAYKYEEIYGTTFFHPMRKHLAWYTHGFEGAKELRVQLIKSNSAHEVEEILRRHLQEGGN